MFIHRTRSQSQRNTGTGLLVSHWSQSSLAVLSSTIAPQNESCAGEMHAKGIRTLTESSLRLQYNHRLPQPRKEICACEMRTTGFWFLNDLSLRKWQYHRLPHPKETPVPVRQASSDSGLSLNYVVACGGISDSRIQERDLCR